VLLNGYVQINGETHLWVARRSINRQYFPGMLDHIVAGGQVRSSLSSSYSSSLPPPPLFL
jgi:hypothetical protein